MTDWATELFKRQGPKANQHIQQYTDQITPYRLLPEDRGWEKLGWQTVNNLTLEELCLEPYLFKLQSGEYLCGSEEVWKKLEGKRRGWIIDLIDSMVSQWSHRGATTKYFWKRSWHLLLCTIWAMKYLKATLVQPEGNHCVRSKS